VGASEADVVVLICNAQEGLAAADEGIVNWLRNV
jgi:predicted GTPase